MPISFHTTGALRPSMVEHLCRILLIQKMSLNLLCEQESDKSRLLADIESTLLLLSPTDEEHFANIIRLDMKGFKKDGAGCLRSMAQKADLVKKIDPTLEGIENDIKTSTQVFVFLLDNYDAILNNENIDTAYNEAFFGAIRVWKEMSNVRFLFVSQQPIKNSLVWIKGEWDTCSRLDVQIEPLPALSLAEKRAELSRKALTKPLQEAEKEQLIAITPYALFDFMLNELTKRDNQATIPFDKQLNLWKKAYQKQNVLPFDTKVVKFRKKIAHYKSLLFPFYDNHKKLINWTAGGGIALVFTKITKAWEWLQQFW